MYSFGSVDEVVDKPVLVFVDDDGCDFAQIPHDFGHRHSYDHCCLVRCYYFDIVSFRKNRRELMVATILYLD